MNSRHKSSKLNQSVLCFPISSYGFDFKCLIVSKQTQRILEMISPSMASSRSRTSAVESNLRCCFHESSCSLPCYVTVDLQMHQCISRCERPHYRYSRSRLLTHGSGGVTCMINPRWRGNRAKNYKTLQGNQCFSRFKASR